MRFTSRGGSNLVIMLATLLGARVVRAQPSELRLADVVAVAVRQSPDLERARIDLDAARADLLRVSGTQDTIVGARIGVEAEQTSATDPAGQTTQSTVSASLSAARRLSTGGQVSLTASDARVHSNVVAFNASGERSSLFLLESQHTASLLVGLSQPLLRGAWATAFEAPIHQAERQRDAAALTQEARARDLVVSITQAYWQVAFAWRQLEVRKAALDLAQKQLAYTEGAIRAEKVPRSESLAVQEAIATRKQDVLASEQDVYERSLALRQLAGLEIGPDALAVTTEALAVKVPAAALELPATVRAAFEHSPELAALAAARQAAEDGVVAADGAARSRLDLDVSAGPIGVDVSPSKAVAAGVDHTGYQVSASLTFAHAIERSTERGGQAAARAVLARARTAEREGRARLAVRTTRAVQRAQAALASIALGDEAIGLAEQNVTAEQKRFELGKSTNNEVLRRQDELQQTRLRHASAIADYLAARADLDGLSGAILARYGIVMP
jgi:outer membrane protein TolC